MHEIYELKEKLMKELGEYGSQEMTAGSLQVIDTLAHSIKNLCKIIESAEEEEGGSYYREGRGGSSRRGSYYADGGSYYERRGRGRNASRDGRGRYNEGSYREGSYRDGMMRRGSYYRDGGKEEFMSELQELMNEAPDEQSRQSIQRMISQMEQQM